MKTPGEILITKNERKTELIQRIEEEIAAQLEHKFYGDPVQVWLNIAFITFKEISPDIKKSLEESGWRLERTGAGCHLTRDETVLTITAVDKSITDVDQDRFVWGDYDAEA